MSIRRVRRGDCVRIIVHSELNEIIDVKKGDVGKVVERIGDEVYVYLPNNSYCDNEEDGLLFIEYELKKITKQEYFLEVL